MELVKYLLISIGLAVVIVFGTIFLKNLVMFLYEYITKSASRFNKSLNGYFDSVIDNNFGSDKAENVTNDADTKVDGESLIERLTIEKMQDKKCEEETYEIINSLLDDDYILKDVYLNYNGIIYAIDMIVVYTSGIYAIEAKTLEGYVKGSIDNEKWVQTDKHGKVMEFENPIKYNLNQVNALYEFLKNEINVSYDCFKEYLLINGYTKLNFKDVNKDNKYIINPKKFDNIFRKEIVSDGKILTNQEVIDILKILKEKCEFGEKGRNNYLNQFK